MNGFLSPSRNATRNPYTRFFGQYRVKLFGVALLTLLVAFAGKASAQPVTEAELRGHIEALASEEFAGRRPGTPGEDKTIAYIAQQWAQAGLTAGSSEGNWFAPVLLYGNSYELGGMPPEEDYDPFWSFNVVGRIAGTDPAAGAVLFLGHWDHFGQCNIGLTADRLCNGAVDNASGIALLIAVAQRLKRAGPFERDIYFLATTGEEIGLIGARAFADDPPRPLEDFVAIFNVDSVALSAQTERVAMIGGTHAPFEEKLAEVVAKSGLTLVQDAYLDAYTDRHDGFAFTERGVPAVMLNSGFADRDALQRFLDGRYHGPDDEADAALELRGAVADADLHVALGRLFADKSRYDPGRSEKAAGMESPE